MYGFVRGRQLEGTYPGDGVTGVWITTAMRVYKGWGCATESEWSHAAAQWPPVEPPGIDELAKANRLFGYLRLRTIDDCRHVLAGGRSLPACAFEIDDSWNNAPGGNVADPRGHQPNGKSHAVALCGYDDRTERFTFANSWGEAWGDKGYGYLPYEYMRSRLLEAWCMDSDRPPRRDNRLTSGVVMQRTGVVDPLGRALHIVEVEDRTRDEMIGWAFLVDTADGAEVEELFVRPAYRGQGHGRELTKEISAHRPARAWISRGDWPGSATRAQAAVLGQLGLTPVQTTERWAAALAVRR